MGRGGGQSPMMQEAAIAQLRVLGFGFFQDWDVGIGVFPKVRKSR
jgi:hypothetical protein